MRKEEPNLPSSSPVLWIVTRLVSVQLLAYTEVPCFDGLYFLVQQAGIILKEMLTALDIYSGNIRSVLSR